jgi:alpha-L-arabinofuranosidase
MKQFFTFFSGLIFFSASAQHNISVNTSTILNTAGNHPVGMNVNHLMDDKYLSPIPARSTQQALQDMGVKFLRYPGGEKADNYLWSVSPWDKPNPRVTRPGSCEWPSGDTRFMNSDFTTCKSNVLDFEEFMTMSKAMGAEPLIVVAYDGMYKPASCGSIPTKAQLIKNAEEWVRYANITKKYNIKYWMIGNESYMSCNYNGCATATQYRNDVIEFSKAMKAVDPSIKIIVNGDSESWWQTVLPTASSHIDFLGLSNYPVWQYSGGYDYYRTRTPDLLPAVKRASNSINQYAPSSERDRLKIIVTEFGSMDWSGIWADINDLGHALVSFEIMGDQLKHPKVVGSYFWNTRWINNATKNHDIYDALNKNGGFNANGLAHSIWGRFLTGGNIVQASSTTQIRTFANHNPQTNKLNLFIINKETSSQSVNISLNGFASNATGARWEFKGTGVSSVSPTLQQNGTVTASGNTLSLALPATSITVLELSAPTTASTTTLAAPTASDVSRCGSGTVTLTASGGTNYRWYKNSSGGSILHTGSSFTTPSLTQTDTFYVSSFNSTTESSRTMVRAIIHAVPDQPVAQDVSRCGSGSLTLSASGGTNYRWFSVSSGGSSLHTGSTYTTPSLNTSTSYWVESFNTNCSSTRKEVKAIIHAVPDQPVAQDVSRCGSGSLTLSASGGTNYRWFNVSLGGSALHTGSTYTTPSLSTSTSYWVESFNSNCSSTRKEVKAIIHTVPDQPVAQDVSRCGSGSLTLSASGSTNYRWFSVSSGGSAIHLGALFSSPNLNETTTYWVEGFSGECISQRVPVKSIIEDQPKAPIAQNAERCGPGTVNLSVREGSNCKWYSQAMGGNPIFSGETFTTPEISANTIFYVENTTEACVSERVSVLATVNDLPGKPEIIRVNSDTLMSSSEGISYMWILNGETLADNTRAVKISDSGIYMVRVIAENECVSMPSEEYAVISTLVEASNKNTAIKVYPNPNPGRFNVEIPQAPENTELDIMDLTGKLIFSEKYPGGDLKREISLGPQAKGVYFLRVKRGEDYQSIKLIIRE